MEMQNVKNKVTNVFTPARLKKAAAHAVLIGIVSAGGAYYHHSRAEALSMQEKQARSEMIAAPAANPAPAAAPTDAGTPSGTPAGTAPAPVAPPVQPAPMMGQPNFHPVYKVKCCAGNVEYKLHIDAVTGTVLSSKADVDDDLF